MVKQIADNRREVSTKETVTVKKEIRNVAYDFGSGDELIASLANSYENRRARQVYEWELVRRKTSQAPV